MAGCVAIAGVSDFGVDACFDGCKDGDVPDSPARETSPPPDGPSGLDTGLDAADAADVSPPPSPGLSAVTLSLGAIAVSKTTIATLTAKDGAGGPIPRTGGKVVFTTKAGTSVVSIGTVVDNGDGTYAAILTGLTEGTTLDVSATFDGAALTTPPAKLDVGRVTQGLTFALEAGNADRANHFGGKNCPASGLSQWTDLSASAFPGALAGFADPCTAGSGWEGAGTPASPYRLAFDGVDDHVNFGAVNALQKYTVLAWVRKNGTGFTGTSGTGGLTFVTPIVAKGTAEGETDAIDINYYLGIASTGALAADYEENPGSGNNPLVGATVLADNQWYMIGTTLDAAAPGTRSLYVNAAVDGTLTPTLPPSGAASSLLVIGGARRTDAAGVTCPGAAGSTGCGRFKGDIAMVLIYDRALATDEIERNCHTFKSRFGMTCPN